MRKIAWTITAISLALSLAGCMGQGEETATPPPDIAYNTMVSVTGEVTPKEWATVSSQAGGKVAEIPVDVGDEVAAGDVLVRLDCTDAQLAVQEAEAAVESARAQVALVKAAARREEVAAAEEQAEAAQAALSQAVAQRNRLVSGELEAQVAAAELEVAEAEARHRAALIEHDRVQGDEGAEDWAKQEAVLRLRSAEQAVEAARMQLARVQGSVPAQRREANAAVQAATAQREQAQAQLELVQAQATAEQVAVAQADVAQAEAALDAARVAVGRCRVRAPLGGTVGAVDVREGERVTPGQALITLGDLSTLRVETTDLDEIDVARVAVGQEVSVMFDALPERSFAGRVTRIDPMAQPGSGGVNYRAIVDLDKIDPAVRWGMTAFVDIEVGE